MPEEVARSAVFVRASNCVSISPRSPCVSFESATLRICGSVGRVRHMWHASSSDIAVCGLLVSFILPYRIWHVARVVR